MKQLNWATLGCGVIANELAHALSKEGRTLYSVANRTHEKAVAFAQKYGTSDRNGGRHIRCRRCSLPMTLGKGPHR